MGVGLDQTFCLLVSYPYVLFINGGQGGHDNDFFLVLSLCSIFLLLPAVAVASSLIVTLAVWLECVIFVLVFSVAFGTSVSQPVFVD